MQHEQSGRARIMIVDDHSIVRDGMAMLINREPDLQACCQAEHIEEAVEANRACPHDLAIVDLSLAGSSGLELVRRLQFEFPKLPVLMLSMHDESVYAEAAMRAGARGYLMKQMATTELLQAIRKVLSGETYLSDRMRSKMLMNDKSEEGSLVGKLSPSETEVLHLIGLGMGTAEIAARLCRSVKTIESHKANIKKKLALDNANQLALFAINFVAAGASVPPGE